MLKSLFIKRVFSRKTLVLKSLFIKRVFSCEYCEILKNSYFEELTHTAAFGSTKIKFADILRKIFIVKMFVIALVYGSPW